MRLITSFFLLTLLLALTGGRCLAATPEAPDTATVDAVILGDSNTWIGGDNCDNPRGWNYWWHELTLPNSVRSYARSGATWTNTSRTRRNLTEDTQILSTDNVIYNQVCRLIAAADSGRQTDPTLIMILAGTNDAWFSNHRPGLFSEYPDELDYKTIGALRPSQATSLARSVLLSCRLLADRFPKARIVLITPPQTTATTLAMIERVSDIIDRCGRQTGLQVIRLDRDGPVKAADEKRRLSLTTDGTHTSAEGARAVALYIIEALDGSAR